MASASASASKRVMRKDLYDSSAEWTHEEQATLERLLVRYAKLPRVLCFARISSELKDKTVRDVALRVRWMKIIETRKRRKDHDVELARKRKDKEVPSQIQLAIPSHPPPQIQVAILSHPSPQIQGVMPIISCSSTPTNDVIKELLDQNKKIMERIIMNIASDELHLNIVLFEQIKENMVQVTLEMNNRGVKNVYSHLSVQPDEICIPPTPAQHYDVIINLQTPRQ